MDRLMGLIDVIILGARAIDRKMAEATIEQARKAALAGERRRHPSAGGINLGLDELVTPRRPIHRHVRAG